MERSFDQAVPTQAAKVQKDLLRVGRDFSFALDLRSVPAVGIDRLNVVQHQMLAACSTRQ